LFWHIDRRGRADLQQGEVPHRVDLELTAAQRARLDAAG
jgi:hypothetical protein